jgi:hypothetical protein
LNVTVIINKSHNSLNCRWWSLFIVSIKRYRWQKDNSPVNPLGVLFVVDIHPYLLYKKCGGFSGLLQVSLTMDWFATTL